MIESLIPGWEFREAVRNVWHGRNDSWMVRFVRNTDGLTIFTRGEVLRDALAEAAALCTAADDALQCNT